MPLDREHQPRATESGADAGVEAAETPRSNNQIQFSTHGAIPAVGGRGSASQPSASQRGYDVQMKKADLPKGEEGFKQMWDAHPHNNSDEADVNTDSETVLDEHGLPKEFQNTCAIRLSIMLNEIGETITPAKTKAAGIARSPFYSKKTKKYYILAASEVWKYITNTFRKPDVSFPKQGRYKDSSSFQEGFEKEIKPAVAGKRGIVAFDKIFTYSGTGHMDLFDGEKLSDSSSWYESQRIELWYI